MCLHHVRSLRPKTISWYSSIIQQFEAGRFKNHDPSSTAATFYTNLAQEKWSYYHSAPRKAEYYLWIISRWGLLRVWLESQTNGRIPYRTNSVLAVMIASRWNFKHPSSSTYLDTHTLCSSLEVECADRACPGCHEQRQRREATRSNSMIDGASPGGKLLNRSGSSWTRSCGCAWWAAA